MRKRKEKIIEQLEVTGMASEGKCVARHDNQVIFIKGVAPGDVVDVRVTRKKKTFMEAVPVAFHTYSKLRQEPFCEHFGTCGGCKWQHIQYDEQLKLKQLQVTENLERIGKIAIADQREILGSAQTEYYRNKLEYTFTSHRWLTEEEIRSGEEFNRNGVGFHIPGRFDLILDINKCWLQSDFSNEIRLAVKEFAIEQDLSFYTIKSHEGLLRNLIVRTSSTGENMVIVQFGEDNPEQIELVMNHIAEKFPEITSLMYIINLKGNETFGDLEVVCFNGRDHIFEEMEGLKFKIGPKSFYQTNSNQAYELYKLTRDFAGLNAENIVYDLYTGTGTIANFVARKVKKVVGVEYVPEAIVDAKINSEINGIDNTAFYAGDMKDIFTEKFIADNGKPDVIITDPPRAGMHENVIDVLRKITAKKIVYVSCNPATQARDIEMLSDLYQVSISQPVDMFPHTHHCENVVLLELK
ncbi:MAG: 23S rRNA (uracil(1939)-C(5))-methyltransferase RlmD [Cyclobacteriaceae bacterium]